MNFKNIKSVDQHYKYPMSYRFGSIYDNFGIIRSYSNGLNNDFETQKYFYYKIKNERIKQKFKQNMENDKTLRLIVKNGKSVTDKGLYKVKGFYRNYVRLASLHL